MSRIFSFLCICLVGWNALHAQETPKPTPTVTDKVKGLTPYEGFFRFYWSDKEGKIYLEVDKWEQEFLYVNSLPAGIGSNDIGLDRNQLGSERIVKFVRSGPKVLLLQPNYRYRAESDNAEERQAVAEAFAQSVLWGFKAEAIEGNRVLIDLTPFLMEDAHGVVERLKQAKQGTYKVDATRSIVYLERTKNFPRNSEFEAMLTLTGEPQGGFIRSVTPTPEAVTVRQHHSFVQLPEAGYEPRVFDPRSGYYPLTYFDYATPIASPLAKRFIQRHRLEKKDPSAAISDPVEPIIYYLDRGVPEPIRSALLEGARWWNQAFEAAGYRNAFQVEVLPADADPMDVRYNVINWVHRSTRGWSYGSSVIDPRTGEIIKGHVLLGSLRVRQDFLIAQGLVEAYAEGETPDPRLEELALARLRQLSAHEVGHTLGISHNFTASFNDRASVMDYPHPYITLDANGRIDFSQSYATGIGEWDKQAIIYGYQDFPAGVDEKQGLQNVLAETQRRGLLYLSDEDARPVSGAHPYAHLWDNGQAAADEFKRLSLVRRKAMLAFSEKNIPVGAPMASLENVFVPLYLMHRYQVEAVSKLIGGRQYSYAVRGDGSPPVMPVDVSVQRGALQALLQTLEPAFLEIPEKTLKLLPPQPIGYERDRELFKVKTGLTFDPISAAEASADHTLNYLLNPARLARLLDQSAWSGNQLSLYDLLQEVQLQMARQVNDADTDYRRNLAMMVEKLYVHHLITLAGNKTIQSQVAAAAWAQLLTLHEQLAGRAPAGQRPSALKAHLIYLRETIDAFRRNPEALKLPEAPALPDGSPIGCDG